jgi:argininosuccinate lyase
MAEKPWDGAYSEPTDKMVERFTASHAADRRLYRQDIAGSIAHCRALLKAGVLTAEEAARLVAGLRAVEGEIRDGRLAFSDALEDVHMHVEARLGELIGPLAKKLHTGRSRNDQVALDLRLYLLEEGRGVVSAFLDLRAALLETAAKHTETFVPGYTHLQRAQPVLLAHHLLAYHEMFARDTERFSACLARTAVSPLGAAALAGTTYPLDREYTAGLLGFSNATANSMDSVSDRDFALEFASVAAIAMVHLSRLAEEIVLWSSREFRFIRLPDAFATGSSIMPQKKNPDVAELVRGKTGRAVGNLVTLLTMMKGLPLSYNRDMQEDKAPLFDSVETARDSAAVFARMLPRLEFDTRRMLAACRDGYLDATDLADYLVAKGVPFREAHGIAGRAVAHGISRGKELWEFSLEEFQELSPRIGPDIFKALDIETIVNRRLTLGGTARERVRRALEEAGKRLAAERERGETLARLGGARSGEEGGAE